MEVCTLRKIAHNLYSDWASNKLNLKILTINHELWFWLSASQNSQRFSGISLRLLLSCYSSAASYQDNPTVKSSDPLCLNVYFNNCRASISSGVIRFWWGVIVSFADEKTHSHGMDDACMGRISIASWKIVGNWDRQVACYFLLLI